MGDDRNEWCYIFLVHSSGTGILPVSNRLCEEKNLTQQELAKLMETSQQAVSRIESGEYEGMTLKTLEKIAKATGTWLKVDFVTVL